MIIDKFRRKREMNQSHFYDYEAYNEGKLKCVFWADGICHKNYSLFGDVISFDIIYSGVEEMKNEGENLIFSRFDNVG